MKNTSFEKRSYIMSCIRSENTKPEMVLRKALFNKGYRYRLHVKDLPGKPDLVLPRYNTIIFVHGCFWHMHGSCRENMVPKGNASYWIPKLKRNIERDALHQSALLKSGWKVIIVWECDIRKRLQSVVENIALQLM